MKSSRNRVALCWALVALLGLSINGRSQSALTDNVWRLLEVGMLLALLLGLGSRRPLLAAFQRLGAVRAAALLCVLCLIGVGQVADRARLTYPFVPWSMYSHADVIPEYLEYLAILESGKAIDFPFHRVIPTREPRSLSYNFSGRLRRTNGSDDDLSARKEASRIILSLAETYNARYPIDPIRSIEIRLRSIPVHDAAGPEPVVIRSLGRYSVPEPSSH